jgi:hypothetical protein
MKIEEIKSRALGLVAEASLAKKDDKLDAAWKSLENLYKDAAATFPARVTGFSLKDQPKAWANLSKLAWVIVTGCEHIEPSPPNEVPGDYGT